MKPLALVFCATLFATSFALAPASAQEAAKDPKAKASPEELARLQARINAARKAAEAEYAEAKAKREAMERNAPRLPAK